MELMITIKTIENGYDVIKFSFTFETKSGAVKEKFFSTTEEAVHFLKTTKFTEKKIWMKLWTSHGSGFCYFRPAPVFLRFLSKSI